MCLDANCFDCFLYLQKLFYGRNKYNVDLRALEACWSHFNSIFSMHSYALTCQVQGSIARLRDMVLTSNQNHLIGNLLNCQDLSCWTFQSKQLPRYRLKHPPVPLPVPQLSQKVVPAGTLLQCDRAHANEALSPLPLYKELHTSSRSVRDETETRPGTGRVSCTT